MEQFIQKNALKLDICANVTIGSDELGKKQYKKKSTADLIKEFKQVHQELYIYDELEYLGANEKVKIVCRKHGAFYQYTFHHRAGKGCKKCGDDKQKNNFDEVKINFSKVHRNRYDYSKAEYINNYTKLEVQCKVHGSFMVRPTKHLEGVGCPYCRQANS